jgi:Flp pilus assembly protein TadD
MKKAPLSLELVPMDVPASHEAPAATSSTRESSTTTTPAQDVVAAAEAALDAHSIDIEPFERTFPKPAPRPPLPVAPAVSGSSADPFIAQALREYGQGDLDTPLWDHYLKLNDGNAEAAAAAYIPARAVALRMLGRKRPGAADRATARAPANDGPVSPEPSFWQRYRLAIVAAAVIVPASIAGAVLMSSRGDQTAPAAPAAAQARKAPAAAPAPARPPAAQAAAKPSASVALAQKVQELRDAGNFNVMVLYATEWTRKEPDNATAWDELRVGYVHLRQYDDARNAAKKAVQLAPEETRLWRNLAAVNLDLDDPEAALAAYEQAVARNSVDVDSLNAIALLQTRLGHPAEAKSAFERAAAASPGDAVTACLRGGIAQMPAARDAYTLSRQVRAIDDRCHGRAEPVAAR